MAKQEENSRVPTNVVRQAIERRINLREQVPDDEEFQRRFPNIWEWATFFDMSGERVKERPTFSFRANEGQWTLSISDKSMAGSLTVHAVTFQRALEALDERLGNADADWVSWKGKEMKFRDRPKRK